MRNYISSVLFLVVTSMVLTYVAFEVDQFNTEMSRALVSSFR